MPKNHRGEPTRVTGLFSREGAVPPRQNDMSALAYLRSQAAEARASGEKPYSLFMVSPERVLGMKRAAEVGADAPRDPRPVTRRFASPRPRRKRFFFLLPSSTLTGIPPSPPATIRSRSGASKTAATRRLIATPRRREPRSRRYDPREMTRTSLPSSRLARISAFRDRSELTSPPIPPVRSTSAPSPTITRMRYASDPCDNTHEHRARSIRRCAIPPSRPRAIRSRPRYPPRHTRAQESRYNLRSKTPTTMMKSMNKLGLYVPPAMRNPKDPETDGTVQKTEGRKVGFAIPAPRVEVYKSSNRENHPPGFGPSSNNVEGAPSAKELPTPKPAPLAAICRNAAVASRKRSSTADVGGKSGVNSSEGGGGARRGSRSRGGRGRSGSSTRTVTVVIPKASAGPR